MDYVRVHNPQKSSARRKSARRAKNAGAQAAKRSKNPLPMLIELSGMAAGNPQKRSKQKMAKSKASKNPRRKNPMMHRKSAGVTHHKKRKNPSRTGRRRRNPTGLGGFASKGIGTLKNGFWALVGLVITRQLPQMILNTKNTGAMGYIANAVAAFAAGFGISKFAGTDAGSAALLGGGLYVVNRVIQDNFSPVGKVLSLAGMGDASSLGEILSGDRTYFPEPVAYDNDRNPIIPSQIKARPLPVVAATTGMGNMYRRRVAA